MTGTPLETLRLRADFARSYNTPSMLSPRIPTLGPAMGAGLDGTSSLGFPSAWCMCSALTKSRSSLWLTAGDGRAMAVATLICAVGDIGNKTVRGHG